MQAQVAYLPMFRQENEDLHLLETTMVYIQNLPGKNNHILRIKEATTPINRREKENEESRVEHCVKESSY